MDEKTRMKINIKDRTIAQEQKNVNKNIRGRTSDKKTIWGKTCTTTNTMGTGRASTKGIVS